MKSFHQSSNNRSKFISYSTYFKNQSIHHNKSFNQPASKSKLKIKEYLSNNISKNQQFMKIGPKEVRFSLERKRINSLSQDHIKIQLALKGFSKNTEKKNQNKLHNKSNSQAKIIDNPNNRYNAVANKKVANKASQKQKSKYLQDNHMKKINENLKHKSFSKINTLDKVQNSSKNKRKCNSALSSSKNNSSNVSKKSNQIGYQKSRQTKSIQKLPFQLKFYYSYRTKQGALFSNPKKPNQDNFIIKENLITRNGKQVHLFAVADGHGVHGHHVSKTIVDNISNLLTQQLEKSIILKALLRSYQALQNILTMNTQQINIMCSGSTLVTILLEGSTLTCANTGDSRAILGRQIDRKCWEIIHLSQDHKPNLEKQKKRIYKYGGRIHAFKDQYGMSVGPMRVWLPNQNAQGLAMSRSLGDNISKQIGVTHQPQLIKIQLQSRDKFILLATDGVWQFITNQQVLQLIAPYYRDNKLQEACNALLKLAYQKWTVEDTSVIDDITFILIFLNR